MPWEEKTMETANMGGFLVSLWRVRTAQRASSRLMRWLPGGVSGHELTGELGLGQQTDYRAGEMPLPVSHSSMTEPTQESKRSRDGPGPSNSVDTYSAAPPLTISINAPEKSKFLTENKPKNNHHKMYRQIF